MVQDGWPRLISNSITTPCVDGTLHRDRADTILDKFLTRTLEGQSDFILGIRKGHSRPEEYAKTTNSQDSKRLLNNRLYYIMWKCNNTDACVAEGYQGLAGTLNSKNIMKR